MLKSNARLLSTSMAITAGMVTLICDVDAALVPVLVVAPVAKAIVGANPKTTPITTLPTFIAVSIGHQYLSVNVISAVEPVTALNV